MTTKRAIAGSYYSSRRRSGSSPPPPPPPSGSYQPFLAASAINTPIPANPVIHPGSANMISVSNNWLLGGTSLDADKTWMEPISRTTDRASYFRGDVSKIPTVAMYANNNGWVGAGPYTMPMPSWMPSVHGPYSQSGDGNIVIVDSVTGDIWELWHATPPSYAPRDAGFPSTRWNCSSYRKWATATKTNLGYNLGGYTVSNPPGTSGSKIMLAAGMLVPEDVADCWSGSDPGTVIPHALRMDTFCGSNGATYPVNVGPATGGDGKQSQGIPAGSRTQLDPSINVATWPSVVSQPEPWRSTLIKLLRTMQVYGIIQVDSYGAAGAGSIDCASGPSLAQGSDTYPVGYQWPWDAAGVGSTYKHAVPYDLMDNFRVLDWAHFTGV